MGYIYAVGYTMPSFETTIRKPLSSKSSHRLTSAPMETHPLSREYVNGEAEGREGKGREAKRARSLPVLLRWGGGRLATEMERLYRGRGIAITVISRGTRGPRSPPRPRERAAVANGSHL